MAKGEYWYGGSRVSQMEYEQLLSTNEALQDWIVSGVTLPEIDPGTDEDGRKIIEISKFLTKKKSHFSPENDPLSFTVADIKAWYRSEKYTKKYYDYKRLAEYLRKAHDQVTISNTIYLPYADQDAVRKLQLVESLVSLADQMSQAYVDTLDPHFQFLELQLASYLTDFDRTVLNASGFSLDQVNLASFLARKVQYLIVRIVRKLRRLRKRDVRTALREFVRFHFKNMDDETDAVGIFNPVLKNSLTVKNIQKWKFNKSSKYSEVYLPI